MLSHVHVTNIEHEESRNFCNTTFLFSTEAFSYLVCVFLFIPVICLGLHYFTCANTSILLHINVRRIINAGSTDEENIDLQKKLLGCHYKNPV